MLLLVRQPPIVNVGQGARQDETDRLQPETSQRLRDWAQALNFGVLERRKRIPPMAVQSAWRPFKLASV